METSSFLIKWVYWNDMTRLWWNSWEWDHGECWRTTTLLEAILNLCFQYLYSLYTRIHNTTPSLIKQTAYLHKIIFQNHKKLEHTLEKQILTNRKKNQYIKPSPMVSINYIFKNRSSNWWLWRTSTLFLAVFSSWGKKTT